MQVLSIDLWGQTPVGLRIDTTTPTGPRQGIFCDQAYNCGLLPNQDWKYATFGKHKMPMSIEREGNDLLITIDSNGNFDLKDEKKVRLSKNGGSVVKIKKRVTTRRIISLPYEIIHTTENENGKDFDSLSIRAHYVLLGTFRKSRCVMEIALNDISAEGIFNLSNGDRGTNLQIDRNRDGKFWGKGEFISTNEIIELCGRNYTVSFLSFSRIVFRPTSLKLAKVGEKSVDFSIKLLNGSLFTPDSMKGRAFILDFWASWCEPCVDNLPKIKKLRDELISSVDVFSINVDKPVRRRLAEQIIKTHDLMAFSSIRGLGDDDPIWKAFGGANQNHLAIPLYVLIDKEGIIRYSGNGGLDLADLKAAIDTVFAIEKR
jgi:thiol-disulfide isomerase/thioredoxin